MRLRDIKTVEDHIKAVAAWLDENVETPSTPRVLTIHDIQINRLDEPRGSFTARLDGTEFPGCTFMTQQNGHFGFCPPMYCSPLGAPASYAAVDGDCMKRARCDTWNAMSGIVMHAAYMALAQRQRPC